MLRPLRNIEGLVFAKSLITPSIVTFAVPATTTQCSNGGNASVLTTPRPVSRLCVYLVALACVDRVIFTPWTINFLCIWCSERPWALICSTTFFTPAPNCDLQQERHLWFVQQPIFYPNGSHQTRLGIDITILSLWLITSPWLTFPCSFFLLISIGKTMIQHHSNLHS